MGEHDDRIDLAQQRLAVLRERFGNRLRDRMATLRGLVEQAQADGTAASLDGAVAAAHQLAGTAGSYGFVEVGEAVAELERLLPEALQAGWAAAAEALQRAEESLG